MKYTFVILIALLVIRNSVEQNPDWICVEREDGSCRFVLNLRRLKDLNDHFNIKERYWYVTNFSECEYVKELGEISYCKSTCDTARNGNYEKYDCPGKRISCAANKITDQCTVYRDNCALIYAYCIENKKDLFAAQPFRCTHKGLTQVGQTGQCAAKNPNKTMFHGFY